MSVRTRAVAAAVLALALPLTGCGSEVYIGVGPDPSSGPMLCEQTGRPRGMQVLMAQSVPTASAVPCLRTEPQNWTLGEFDFRNGHSKLVFSYHFGSDTETATI